MNSLALFGIIFAFCIITGLFIILFTNISQINISISNLNKKENGLMRYYSSLEGRLNTVELKLAKLDEQLNPAEEEE